MSPYDRFKSNTAPKTKQTNLLWFLLLGLGIFIYCHQTGIIELDPSDPNQQVIHENDNQDQPLPVIDDSSDASEKYDPNKLFIYRVLESRAGRPGWLSAQDNNEKFWSKELPEAGFKTDKFDPEDTDSGQKHKDAQILIEAAKKFNGTDPPFTLIANPSRTNGDGHVLDVIPFRESGTSKSDLDSEEDYWRSAIYKFVKE